MATEPQPPSHRREEKEPHVRGETTPEVRNVGAHKIVHQDRESPPCTRRCGALVGEDQVGQRVQRKHDRRSDDAVGKTGEASHHHETADPYEGADQARLRLAHLDPARRLRSQPMPERQKPVQKSLASSRNLGGNRVHVFPLSTHDARQRLPDRAAKHCVCNDVERRGFRVHDHHARPRVLRGGHRPRDRVDLQARAD